VTCVLGLSDEVWSPSSCDSCGEMKRAVGRGPVLEGPRVFFKIGCGMGPAARDATDEEAVLGWPRARC
jgi:hypothetical protein